MKIGERILNNSFSNRQNGIADKLFIERWSPRSFSAELMPSADLKKLIDAARWSPSTLNEQPWLFFTAHRKSAKFNDFVNCLSEGNQVWARNAAVLGFLIARKFFKNKTRENQLAQFDCGAAWMALTMQARLLGFFTHGMGGIDRNMVRDLLLLNEQEHSVIMGFAVGKKADSQSLPENLRDKEKPSNRDDLESFWKSF